MNHKRYSAPILPAALLIGFCANLLFDGKGPGLSLLIFVLLFMAVLFYTGRRSAVHPVRGNLWILAPLFFFAAMVAIRDNPFLTTLNVLAVTGLLTYLILYYAAGQVGDTGLMPAMLIPLYVTGKSMLATPPVIKESVVAPQLLHNSRASLASIAKGAVLAAPLLFIFTILLALADTMYANSIVNLFRPVYFRHLFSLYLQAAFILGVSWMVAGALALVVDKKECASLLNDRFAPIRRFRLLGFTESSTILTLVNLLFLSFVIIQFRYLFSGAANIDRIGNGYTYAEYARKGFFELLIVAILSLALILGIEAVTWRESKQQLKLFNLQSGLLIGLVIIMLISAFRRMRLYEATYGYTELRLYVYLFMVWLALFLIWFLIGLFRRPDRFTLGALLLVIGFLATLNLINPDAFIVRQNMARYQAVGDLDVSYLESLSADAVPALVKAATIAANSQGLSCPADAGGQSTELCAPEIAQLLQAGLQERYLIMQNETKESPWQAANLSRWRAHELLSNLSP